MSAIQTVPDTQSILRARYDKAFAAWAKQVRILQSSFSNPESTPASIERLRMQVDLAHSEYRQIRDCLYESIR